MRNLAGEFDQAMVESTQLIRPYINHIMHLTGRMVDDALNARWHQLMDRMDERAQVMKQVAILAGDGDAHMVVSLSKALRESDHAMNRIMAHAIITARGGDTTP
jgi:hypothetical protein